MIWKGGKKTPPPTPKISALLTLIFLSLLFWLCLLFLLQGVSLLFLALFPSFPGTLGVQHREKILAFWVVFLAFPKKQGKEDQGRKRPVLLRASFVPTKDRKRPYYGQFCVRYTRRSLVVKRPGVLSKVYGQETKHVKIGHVKIDRAHFRVHFREHWKISRGH